ncbi:hypothetical protein ACERIM_12400 [Natrinema sp. H-ect1]
MQLIETAPHEFAAHFLFAAHGLDPFFACDSRIKDGDGSQHAEFEFEGEPWRATLSYRDSGLEHPGEQLPTGTEFRLAEMRKFDLSVESGEDVGGERSFHAHIAPRWKGMRSEGGNEISVPDDLHEGVNLHVQGSNIEFDRYHPLIQHAARAVGINSRYFDELHDFSTILDAERYVRVDKNESGPVHARDGPIELGHLLENDRTGRRKLVQYDSDEHARDRPGYYHTATLGPRRVREAFPSHELPKEVKHYYAQQAVCLDNNRSIAHPKVGSSIKIYRGSRPRRSERGQGSDEMSCGSRCQGDRSGRTRTGSIDERVHRMGRETRYRCPRSGWGRTSAGVRCRR